MNIDPVVLGSSAIRSWERCQIQKNVIIMETYCLFPTPITRHEVLVTMCTLYAILLQWHIVKFVLEVQISENVVYEQSRVTEPDFIFRSHPGRHFIIWLWTVVLGAEALPCHVAKRSCINGTVHVNMTCEGRRITMSRQRSSPQIRNKVNVTS